MSRACRSRRVFRCGRFRPTVASGTGQAGGGRLRLVPWWVTSLGLSVNTRWPSISRAFASQPFWLLMQLDGKLRSHAPDYFARHRDRSATSAATRRSLANRPDGPFGSVTALRPGELVQIDTTPLDVMALLEEGVPACCRPGSS
jgi:hypothetical protein